MTIRLGRKVKRERGCSFCLFPELTVCQAGNESGCVGLRCGVETAKQTQLSCGAACSVLGLIPGATVEAQTTVDLCRSNLR